jgi:hypothetical protein
VLNGVLTVGQLRMLDEEKRAWHDYWTHTAVVPASGWRRCATCTRTVGMPPPT